MSKVRPGVWKNDAGILYIAYMLLPGSTCQIANRRSAWRQFSERFEVIPPLAVDYSVVYVLGAAKKPRECRDKFILASW